MEVLGDAVAGAPLVGPSGQALVDDRAPLTGAAGQPVHAQHVAPQLVHTTALVGGPHVRHAVGEAVVGQLRAHVPFANARVLAVAPDPSSVEVARGGADADPAEVGIVADVDGEPTPHLRTAPAPRSPRLVAVAARVATELVPGATRLDPARPPSRLLEMALSDGGRRLR